MKVKESLMQEVSTEIVNQAKLYIHSIKTEDISNRKNWNVTYT